jgi:hypothetical protein
VNTICSTGKRLTGEGCNGTDENGREVHVVWKWRELLRKSMLVMESDS